MTRKAIKRLLIAIGLALLLTVVVVLPLHAAPSSQPANSPSTDGVVRITTVLTTITAPPVTHPPHQTPTTSSSPTDAALIYLIPLLFLGLLLTILVLRRKRAKPIPQSPAPPAVPSPPTTGPYLESVRTADGPRRFDLKPDGITIGRALENDLVISQDFPGWETVSQRHAWVYQWANRWIIEDINSTNGIHVNGKRTGRNLLRDGWQLDIGGVEFVFHANTEETEQ